MQARSMEEDPSIHMDWQVALYARCLAAARSTLHLRFGDQFTPHGVRDATVVYNRPPVSEIYPRVTVASDVTTALYRVTQQGHVLVHLEVDMLDETLAGGSCAVAQLTFALARVPTLNR